MITLLLVDKSEEMQQIKAWLLLGILVPWWVAHAREIPVGYESYLTRPDILEVKPQAHPSIDSHFWKRAKLAQLEATAQILELYSDHEIYFLARDSENLYDLARWFSKNDPKTLKKIHLLNISRLNVRASGVESYLAQEGISTQTLKAGKKVVLVDTGFMGSISEALAAKFPPAVRDQIKTHLMCSNNPLHPSTRAFLTRLNPAAIQLEPTLLHGLVKQLEHLPHHTDRSNRFIQVKGQWQPLSPTVGQEDGQVSKVKARQYMEDLLFDAQQPENKKLFELRRSQWREMKQLKTKPEVSKYLQRLLGSQPDPHSEAMVRDYLETSRMNLDWSKDELPDLKKLGLVQGMSTKGLATKETMIKSYPYWSKILSNPKTEIPRLFKKQEFDQLYDLLFVIDDYDIKETISIQLGNKDTPQVREFIKTTIQNKDQNFLNMMARNVFSQGETKNMAGLIELLIENGDEDVLRALADHTFSQPHTKSMKIPLKNLIAKADALTLQRVEVSVLSQPHWDIPEKSIFLKAIKMKSTIKRTEFLNQSLPALDCLPRSLAALLTSS
jgi:hypothetical protein